MNGVAFALALALIGIAGAVDAQDLAPSGEPRGFLPEGVELDASLVAVAQQVAGSGAAEGERELRANYRGDVDVTLPGGAIGGVAGTIFVHFRFGQGSGVVLRPTFTSTPNTTAFQAASGAYDAYAILAQAWYQLIIPLRAGDTQTSGQRLELTAGKIDPTMFFDRNALADDESVRFMNNAFVHHPLLDSGGDAGVDRYGFTPGARIAYATERDDTDRWAISLGVFGSGPNATFTGSLGDAYVITQLETTRRFIAGQPGTYRFYAWRNGRARDFADEGERHAGWGVSVDQRVTGTIALFTRFGGEWQGHVRFDRTLTLGAEIGGDAWGRDADALGLAGGTLRTSDDYRDATADGRLTGYAASGSERIAELYYRWRVNRHVDLSPDVQWIKRPGGDASAPTIFVGGVRARVAL